MATLTIADLDNGKRDLQTVDEVANSRAATATTRFGQQTTTLYEAIRRINATGDEILSNLGFRVPVPYASGLNVTDSRFTVTGPDGKVYAPLSAPFTTGTWDPSQWYVLQNDLNDHKLLIFDTLLAAQTAASVLPDGQLVEAIDVQNRYKTLGGTLVFYEFLPWKNMGWVTPELFGAVGGDPEKDTQAFIAMLASGVKVYRPDALRRYAINQDLDFGQSSLWETTLNIECRVSQTEGQHDPFLLAEGVHIFSGGISVNVPSGITRQAVLRDDFYGGVKPYRKEFHAAWLKLTSETVQGGYTGDGAAAFNLANQDCVRIGSNVISGFQKSAYISNSSDIELGRSVLKDWYRGIQINGCTGLKYSGGEYHAALDPLRAPGDNALVIVGTEQGVIGDMFVYDASEHAVRVGAAWNSDNTEYRGGNLHFGKIHAFRPGKCGLKIHSGTGQTSRVKNVTVDGLYVEDGGWELYQPGATPAEGDNHFGLNIQTADNIRIKEFVSRKNKAQYASAQSLLMRDVNDVEVNIDAADSYSFGYQHNASGVTNRNVTVKGRLIAPGVPTNNGGVGLWESDRYSRFSIELEVYDSTRAAYAAATTGTPPGAIFIRLLCYNVANLAVPTGLPASRVYCQINPITWPTGTTGELPIGTTILTKSDNNSSGSPNSECPVYFAAATTSRYVSVADGQTPVEAVGSRLAGIWVRVGRDNATGLQLMRRTK